VYLLNTYLLSRFLSPAHVMSGSAMYAQLSDMD